MLGTGIFDLSLLGGYCGYKAYKWCEKNQILVDFATSFDFSGDQPRRIPLSAVKTKTLCADMYYCLKKMSKKKVLTSSESFSEYNTIDKKYASLTDKFEIMEEFLSHFELINEYLVKITKQLAGLSAISVYVYNKEYCISAFDESFEIDGQDIKTIIDKFYKQCSIAVHPDQNSNSERSTEVFAKLANWKKTMDQILEK